MLSEPGCLWPGESKHLAFMRRDHRYYVYMMQSSSRRTLYIGVTGDLEKRVFEHRTQRIEGFTAQYRAHRLAYLERFDDIRTAINREKQLKGWTRAKKNWLIERMNPGWKDLSEGWFGTTRSFDSRGQNPGRARSG